MTDQFTDIPQQIEVGGMRWGIRESEDPTQRLHRIVSINHTANTITLSDYLSSHELEAPVRTMIEGSAIALDYDPDGFISNGSILLNADQHVTHIDDNTVTVGTDPVHTEELLKYVRTRIDKISKDNIKLRCAAEDSDYSCPSGSEEDEPSISSVHLDPTFTSASDGSLFRASSGFCAGAAFMIHDQIDRGWGDDAENEHSQ
ncbi:hypothetical protein CYMTET_13012 [Cymbomonas tetramitiformis]|uniref:Uncharacterized protein n=1 Tax=Cymbomonas tetramitiformis TaxID=36881 RepID=A0AAE0LBA0_9CHLO|nr:hypothetical protein CYMTET_13012 [Cymbomonas tetramitiformis]